MVEKIKYNGIEVEADPNRITVFQAGLLLQVSRKRIWERIKYYLNNNGKKGGLEGYCDKKIDRYFTTLEAVKRYDIQRRERMVNMFKFRNG